MELKYPSQSWILDSTPWVPDSRYYTPFFAVELGLWFPVVSGILDSSSCVPDPKGQDFRVPLAKISWILLRGVKYTSGTAQEVACRGPPAPPLFQMVIFFFFTLVTQICHLSHKQGLVIWLTHKQRTDKLCLLVVTNEFVALNDNQKGNFGHIQRIRLKNIQVTLNHCVCWV